MTDYSNLTPVITKLADKIKTWASDAEAIEAWADTIQTEQRIDPTLYSKYDVKRGLRDINGKGVLAGLTEISEVYAYKLDAEGNYLPDAEGKQIPDEGRLYYRGVDVEEIVHGFMSEGRFGFEETAYLLLFGELPTAEQLAKELYTGRYHESP